jgi:hypothetical protein
LRALVSARHGPPEPLGVPERSTSVAAALDRLARALGQDPWLMSMPLLLDGVVAPGQRWHLVDPSGAALPLDPGIECWRFVAAAGGAITKIAVEWGPSGLVPLTMFIAAEVIAA